MSLGNIPAQHGAYALHLRLCQPERLAVGRLGGFLFPAGEYAYLGSALGPGGLRARLGRHLAGDGRPHWHIDYLRRQAEVIAVGWALCGSSRQPPSLECDWSRALAALSVSTIPAPGFGASDCHLGCAAHLVAFPCGVPVIELLVQAAVEPIQVLAFA